MLQTGGMTRAQDTSKVCKQLAVGVVLCKVKLDDNAPDRAGDSDEDALKMCRDYSTRPPPWREPDRCPYFEVVEVPGVDHNHWPVDGDWADDWAMYRELAQGLG